jgi:hypothetical protein
MPYKVDALRSTSVGIGTLSPSAPLEITSNRNADSWAKGNSKFNVLHDNNAGSYYGMSFAVSATHGDGVIQTYNANNGSAQYDLRLQPSGGNVGIGTTSPGEKLHLHVRSTGAHRTLLWSCYNNSWYAKPNLGYLGSGGTYESGALGLFKNTVHSSGHWTESEAVRIQANGVSWLNGGNVGIGVTNPVSTFQVNAYGGEGSTDCLIIGAGTGTGQQNLRIGVNWSGNYCWLQSHQQKPLRLNPSGNSVQYGMGNSTLSDDRIKDNEMYIENATDTLLKLKPQVYDKKLIWNISKLGETSNVNVVRESGLITQDVWYDAPELRHLVHLGEGAEPGEDKPLTDNDPTIDPDYTSWGDNVSLLEYTGLIPYLIKSNQELHERIVEHDAHIADLESANDAKQRRIDELEERVNALVARMEAVENA